MLNRNFEVMFIFRNLIILYLMEVLNFIIYFKGVICLIDINKMLGFRILLYYNLYEYI